MMTVYFVVFFCRFVVTLFACCTSTIRLNSCWMLRQEPGRSVHLTTEYRGGFDPQ